MNPLQTNPELFTNGKFAVEWPYEGSATEIIGFEKYVEKKDGLEDVLILADGDMPTAENLTLIARSTEDMTDEEIKKYDQIKQKAFWEMGSGVTINEPGFYLLKIGVYPFDQSHFKATPPIVIDTRTLTNA